MESKVKILKKSIFILILSLLMLVLQGITNTSEASSSLSLKNLNYDIQLNSDGSMYITERWNIKIKDTNTLFKTFEMDSSKYKGITEVEVYEINNENGTENKSKFNKINEEMYHVTKGSYYALVNQEGKFEIAWGVSVKNETKTYEISYKVEDCIKTYTDCSDLYWQLISKNSAIPADRVTGRIKLPIPVNDKNNLRAWAHGPLNGNIIIENSDTVSFELDYLDENTMLEIRVVSLENGVFAENTKINTTKWESILKQETRNADQANQLRQQYIVNKEKREQRQNFFMKLAILIGLAVGAVSIFKIVKYHRVLKETPEIKPSKQIDYQYYREIPDEKASASEAGFLYYFKNGNFSDKLPKIFSATILNLALKGYLGFSENGKNPDEVRIHILQENSKMKELTDDEENIYKLLCKIPKKDNSFTMKALNNYAKKNYEKFFSIINKFEDKTKKQLETQGKYDEEIITNSKKWSTKAIIYIILALIQFGIAMYLVDINFKSLYATIPIIIILIIDAIYCCKIYSKTRTLTQKGVDEAEEWKGLKRYMEDFSLLNEREVPELVLWEKYLVFATAFGIADRVLEQLKVVYPQIQYMNSTNDDYSEYAYMHLMYNNSLKTAFILSLDKSLSNAYQTSISARVGTSYSGTNFSSGGGFGGGFSGGGGFGGGGGSMGGR